MDICDCRVAFATDKKAPWCTVKKYKDDSAEKSVEVVLFINFMEREKLENKWMNVYEWNKKVVIFINFKWESIHTLQLQDALNTLVATWAALMLDNMTSQQDLIQIFYFDII